MRLAYCNKEAEKNKLACRGLRMLESHNGLHPSLLFERASDMDVDHLKLHRSLNVPCSCHRNYSSGVTDCDV